MTMDPSRKVLQPQPFDIVDQQVRMAGDADGPANMVVVPGCRWAT